MCGPDGTSPEMGSTRFLRPITITLDKSTKLQTPRHNQKNLQPELPLKSPSKSLHLMTPTTTTSASLLKCRGRHGGGRQDTHTHTLARTETKIKYAQHERAGGCVQAPANQMDHLSSQQPAARRPHSCRRWSLGRKR